MYLVIFSGARLLLLHAGFLWLQRVGGCARVVACGHLIGAASLVSVFRFSGCGILALQHVGSSQIED